MGLGPTATIGFADDEGNWVPVSPGSPLPVGVEGGGGGPADWDTLTNKPAVIGAGATAAAARSAIGAGTGSSNLALGTTSTTAKAGDWTPDLSDVSGAADALAEKVDKGAVTGFDSGTELPGSAPEGTVFFLYTEA